MRVLNSNEIMEKTGLSKTTIWRLERAGNFPQRINLSNRRTGWPEEEIDAWLDSRPRGIKAEKVSNG